MSAIALRDGRESGPVLRWTAAALLVGTAHVIAGWWLVGHAFAPLPPPEGVAGVTVEFEPVSVPVPPTAEPKPMEAAGPAPAAQPAEAPDAAPEIAPPAAAPPPAAAVISPPVEPPPAPVEPPPPEPAPPPPVIPAPEIVPPPAPALSDAVLSPPPRPAAKRIAAPQPPKLVPPRRDPGAIARQEAREAQAEERQQALQKARRDARARAAAEARSRRQDAREQARAAEPHEGGGPDRGSAAPVASGAAVANWHGEVLSHIAAYKPDVQVGSEGTARVAIAVDRGGRVTMASLAGSSGDPELDRAAVAMMRRASPVPPPPPGSGGPILLTIPVRFH